MKEYGEVVRLILLLALAVAGINPLFAQAPEITTWSSNGSGAANPQDIMYLVNQSETVTFTITVNQTVDYEWQVNKVVQTATGNSFTWTVPNEGNIWEIHIKVSNANGEDHREWTVSTLSMSEAPDFFDFFTDLISHDRTESDLWNRILPEWEYSSPPPCSSGFAENWTYSFVNSSVSYGTWKFKYRYPAGNTGAWGYDFAYIIDPSVSGYNYASYNKSADAHHHCCVCFGDNGQFSIDYDGSGVYEDGNWHTVLIIRTQDGWFYMWRDGYFELYAYDSTNVNCESMWLRLSEHNDDKLYFDCIEIYQGEYFFPPKEIIYGEYIWNYYCQNYYYYPEKRNGIIIKGRNVTLIDIADSLNNPSLFNYNPGTKTAICYTDLVVYEGSELIIKDETLKFHCDYDGELHFVPKYGSRIYIENSTISSDNTYYWLWNNAGSTTHYGNEVLYTGGGHSTPDSALHNTFPLGHSYHGSLIIKNSIIDNTAHIFFDSPYELNITDTEFKNLHEVDIGNYSVSGSYNNALREQREFAQGDKAFWIYTDDINLKDFTLNNITFTGRTSPIDIAFLINAHRDKLNVYNLNLENENILIKESLGQTYGQSHTCYCGGAPYEWKSYIKSGIGLVNCKFNNLHISPGLFTDCEGMPVEKYGLVKYYLDVLVIDSLGNPVSDALVTVTNEIDGNYPAENLVVITPYCLGEYGCFYHHFRILEGQPVNSVITGTNGHTPLPFDTTNTLIITDYKKIEEDTLEGIKISWKLNSTHWWLLDLDVYDDIHGRIFHHCAQLPYSLFAEEDTQHIKLTYSDADSSFRLIVTNQNDSLILDTGENNITTDISALQFDQLGFEVRQSPYATKEISWDNQGHIKLYTDVYRGIIESHIDNMIIDVDGVGVIEHNDYSSDPGLIPVVEDGFEYYDLSGSTGGNSFTWEFDNIFPILDADGPWVSVWLTNSRTSRSRMSKNINYTYTITASKGNLTGTVRGVDPDETWYCPDPMIPNHTVIIVLGTDQGVMPRLLIYPNPYKGDQAWPEKITFGNLLAQTTIRIYTLSGDLVKKIEHQAQTDGGIEEWDISNIASGVYIYSVKSQSGKKVGKVSIIK
ncbi:T9SS type A sorting domain-containing protein [candidate division WOR-3 bacterium]|nr:T9SS type A sorting domain-containing protein [candidate division WOR-3 bacterium]